MYACVLTSFGKTEREFKKLLRTRVAGISTQYIEWLIHRVINT